MTNLPTPELGLLQGPAQITLMGEAARHASRTENLLSPPAMRQFVLVEPIGVAEAMAAEGHALVNVWQTLAEANRVIEEHVIDPGVVVALSTINMYHPTSRHVKPDSRTAEIPRWLAKRHLESPTIYIPGHMPDGRLDKKILAAGYSEIVDPGLRGGDAIREAARLATELFRSGK